MVRVSIIIPTRNAGQLFKKVLNSIKSQSFKSYEVIVVDTESCDKTLDYAKQAKAKIIRITQKEFTHGYARNLGAEKAKGKYLVFITQDALPSNKNWLKNLITPLSLHDVAGVYGRQIPNSKSNLIEKFFYYKKYPNINKIWTKNNYLETDIIYSDCNSATKKNIFNRMGYNQKVLVSEDYDWAYKILDKGYKILYSKRAAVIHSHDYKLNQIFKKYFDVGYSYTQLYKRNSLNGFIKEGLKFYIEEFLFLIKNNSLYLVPYAIFYDSTKFLGLVIGKNHRFIPEVIKYKLTTNEVLFNKCKD